MRLTIRQYAQILDRALFEAEPDHAKERVVKDFAKTLVKDGRTARVGEILEAWKILYNRRHGIIDVEIEATDKDTADFPRSFAGKRTAVKVTENPLLLGGSIFKIGDYVIDGSVRSKINAIRS